MIATLARRATERGLDVVICTADKDARQLLDEHTRILNLRKGEFLDVDGLKADWGVRPEQVVDTLALTGDAVDNVPGVPGIGLKTAVALLQEFGTIDNLMANLDKVSGAKRKQNLRDHARPSSGPAAHHPRRGPAPRARLGRPEVRRLRRPGVEGYLPRVRLPPLPQRDRGYPPGRRPSGTPTTARSTPPKSWADFAADLAPQPRFSLDTETTAWIPSAPTGGLLLLVGGRRPGILPPRARPPVRPQDCDPQGTGWTPSAPP